jgi:hypothetical protein
MTPMPRRQLVLVAVLALVAVAAYVMLSGPATPAGTAARPSNRQGRGAAELPDAPVVDLRLDRLQGEPEALPEANRDPFRFRPKVVAPPPQPAPRVVTAPAPRVPDPGLPSVPAGPPPPPPIAVKFFGIVVLRGERVATFNDSRGNTFYGKEGDIIEGRYRVLRIDTDSVELAYVDGRGRQTIRLTGQ